MASESVPLLRVGAAFTSERSCKLFPQVNSAALERGAHSPLVFQEVYMPTPDQANIFEKLAGILATYGVYAILLLLVYLVLRAWKQESVATSDTDKAYFRRVATCFTAATLTMMFIAAGVWFYSKFVFRDKTYIQGSVVGLSYQPLAPLDAQSKPLVIEQIEPQSPNIVFYSSRSGLRADSPEDARYTLDWVFSPKVNFSSVAFTFDHQYSALTHQSGSSEPVPAKGAATKVTRAIEREFALDLVKMGYSPSSPFELVYQPDPKDPITRIGKMFRRTPGGESLIEIPWDNAASAATPAVEPISAAMSFLWPPAVYAARDSRSNAFGPNGEYDPQAGRLLRQRLGNSDLSLQLGARLVLVQSGARSFRFVQDSLAQPPDPAYDRGLLVHNLARSVEEIESRKIVIPLPLQLALAETLYDVSDFQGAAHFFQKAGDGPIKDDLTYFHRGFAYSEAHLTKEAIASYDRYLRANIPVSAKAVTLSNQGVLYNNQGDHAKAIELYKQSIRLDPKYALSYNNLAYLYVTQGNNLGEALQASNRSLQLDPENPNLKDTKGWILYKQGHADLALNLVKQAAAALPDNADVQSHLKTLEAASSKAKSTKQ
jgi:tetratricopeptide (TPR) repeat protein